MIPRVASIRIRSILSTLVMLASTGCYGTPERHPVPAELTNLAVIPGVPEARFWGDEWPKFSLDRFENYTEEDFRTQMPAMYEKSHDYLAISGGGANGAFGAGLLAGWSAQGTRPEFTLVTGVSTGALTAPFAFLGPDYDDELKQVYTTTSTADLVKERGILAAAFGDSMSDTIPLRKRMDEWFPPELIDAIGVEHARGRRLFIGTANLDAGRSVIWNVGAIAASDHPGKVELIHDVLMASTAIPIAFPPVMIPVEADGMPYDEMHVDGGTASQVFVYPAAMDFAAITVKLRVKGAPNVYVVRNSFLEPKYNGIQRSLVPIASRSIDSLIRTQGIGDLYQIHSLCMRDGNTFNLAYIPADFDVEPTEGFDPVYMSALFELGYQMAAESYPWEHVPPGFGKP